MSLSTELCPGRLGLAPGPPEAGNFAPAGDGLPAAGLPWAISNGERAGNQTASGTTSNVLRVAMMAPAIQLTHRGVSAKMATASEGRIG